MSKKSELKILKKDKTLWVKEKKNLKRKFGSKSVKRKKTLSGGYWLVYFDGFENPSYI